MSTHPSSDDQTDPQVDYNEEIRVDNSKTIEAVDELMSKLEVVPQQQSSLALSLLWSFAGKMCGTYAQMQEMNEVPSWLENRYTGYQEWIAYFARYAPNNERIRFDPEEAVTRFSSGQAPIIETDIRLLKQRAEARGITIEQAKRAMQVSHHDLVERQALQQKTIAKHREHLINEVKQAMASQQSFETANLYDLTAIFMKTLDKLPLYSDKLFARSMRQRNPVRIRQMDADAKFLDDIIAWADEEYCRLDDLANQPSPIESGIH